jgi:hypothetical protein
MRSLRQVEKQDPENQIDEQKLHALKPIGFAVAVGRLTKLGGHASLRFGSLAF